MTVKNMLKGATVISLLLASLANAQVDFTVTPIKVESPAKTVFPPIEKAIDPNGSFIDVANALAIQKGMTKEQAAALLGQPQFKGNTFSDSEWNYVFKVAANPQKTQFLKCQAQTHFDKSGRLIDFLWSKQICMALIKMKPVQKFTLSSDYLFDFDKATLKPQAIAALTEVANKIKTTNKPLSINVQGHTDYFGSDAYNDKLSLRRAEAVKAQLLSLGVNGNYTTVGLGESQLVAADCGQAKTKKAIECAAPNRRVVISASEAQ